MRTLLRPFAVAVLGILAACGGESARPPDLILVSVDTLRADRLPFYGAERDTGGDPERAFTPAWLAAQGTLFETCWAPAGQTLPSLGGFWTGLPPLEHGATRNEGRLAVPTRLQEWRASGRFQDALALVANRALGPGCGLEQGFARGDYGVMAKELEPNIPDAMLARTREPIADGRRLLVWTHFMSPHQPYEPRESPYAPKPPWRADNDFLYGVHRRGAMEEGLREQIRALYDAEVREASESVRRVLAGLDAQYREAGRGGLLENAVVVFFSDHGEELGERHGYSMHAKSLYSGVIRVPLLVAGPGWTAGARRAAPLGLGEVLPLVLDGVEPAPGPHFAAWRAEFYAARDERWTLVHSPGGEGLSPREPPYDGAYPYPLLALYDRSTDPFEQRDVSAEHPAETRRLLAALGSWYDGLALRDGLNEAVDQDVLADLGYVDGKEPGQGAVPRPDPRLRPLSADDLRLGKR